MLAPIKTTMLDLQAGMVWYTSPHRRPNECDMLVRGQAYLQPRASGRLVHVDTAKVDAGLEVRDGHPLFVALRELISCTQGSQLLVSAM